MVLEKSLFDVYGIDAIYHMSHIDNVASILKYGLLSHDISYNNRLTKRDISDSSVNSRRMKREPIYGQSIHSYVPFYFNPKNAMLYRRRDIQENIVLFAFDRELIAEAGVLFTDGNAASNATRFFCHLEDLSQLAWGCLHANSWNSYPDGKRVRMAEVLVPNKVSTRRVQKIICCSLATYQRVKAMVGERIEVELNCKFYF